MQGPDANSEFTQECEEILLRVSTGLSLLEKSCEKEVIDGLYRDMHTLKGSSLLFGYRNLGRLAHAVEASLDPFRKTGRAVPGTVVDAVYGILSVIEKGVQGVQAEQSDREVAGEIVPKVTALMEAVTRSLGPEYRLSREDIVLPPAGPKPVVERVAPMTPAPMPTSPPSVSLSPSPAPVVEIPNIGSSSSLLKEEPAMESIAKPASGNAPENTEEGAAAAGATIRVNVALLDKLMNLAGELVLVRNQVLQFSRKSDDNEFLNLSQRLDLVTSELQGEVMKTRMQPIGTVFTKFQRVVRDLARELGKKIDLVLQGTETEVDKSLLEAVKDPLTHIVRNSCDHGIETIAERKAAGKPETGRIALRAFHEGGQVVVEIVDDGKGLDRKRILAKAIERGILSSEKAAALTEREVALLIFAPGFSTAEKVSAVSGRGVGMDVVKTNIERVGGSVEVDSTAGHGTRIRLRIPLTLAIVPALLVESLGRSYAIPQVKLVELLRVDSEGEGLKIELLQDRPVYRLRGQILPLVSLATILDDRAQVSREGVSNIVVLSAEGRQFGLIVDAIRDTADIVVKPLSQLLKAMGLYSGATILGDGKVSLILDATGVARRGGVLVEGARKVVVQDGERDVSGADDHTASRSDGQDMLFFSLDAPGQFGMPLCLVHRLEEFPAQAVERSGNDRVVRYRGSILTLIELRQALGLPASEAPRTGGADDDKIRVIVVNKRNHYFGLQVSSIVDILSVESAIESPVKETIGILGNVMVPSGVAVIVDVLAVIDAFVGVPPVERAARGVAASRKKVLFAEDTVFFKRHVLKVLETAGYQVTWAGDGAAALAKLEAAQPGDYDLVLSDIEMPRMNGFQLAAAVRGLENWKKIPIVALTTRYRESDRETGRKAGFDAYLEKLKGDELISALGGLLGAGSPEREAAL